MKTALILSVVFLSITSRAESQRSPYAGETSREVKALSEDEISALLSGAGMGFAKTAELNGYPGPKHALEMAHSLALTDKQKMEIEAVFERMHREATRLGTELVDTERSLDSLFASREADSASAASAIAQSAELRGRIRFAHVRAHLEMMGILTAHQVNVYIEQRGYGSGHDDHSDHKGHRM